MIARSPPPALLWETRKILKSPSCVIEHYVFEPSSDRTSRTWPTVTSGPWAQFTWNVRIPLGLISAIWNLIDPDLENMGVRSSMSIVCTVETLNYEQIWVVETGSFLELDISQSIMAFDQLWGLIACHSYGNAGMRVSFPVRQMLRLLSQSISRNIERLSYAQRLHTRKLVRTLKLNHAFPRQFVLSIIIDQHQHAVFWSSLGAVFHWIPPTHNGDGLPFMFICVSLDWVHCQ